MGICAYREKTNQPKQNSGPEDNVLVRIFIDEGSQFGSSYLFVFSMTIVYF